ncbi:hypothetical protein HCC30_26115 [Streptomyces sp. HNM0574]|nr:hypothetical protein [Streptomyces sp. HNM0574]
MGSNSTETYVKKFTLLGQQQATRVSPRALPRSVPHMSAAEAAIQLKAHGPSFTLASACAPGIARDLIAAGAGDSGCRSPPVALPTPLEERMVVVAEQHGVEVERDALVVLGVFEAALVGEDQPEVQHFEAVLLLEFVALGLQGTVQVFDRGAEDVGTVQEDADGGVLVPEAADDHRVEPGAFVGHQNGEEVRVAHRHLELVTTGVLQADLRACPLRGRPGRVLHRHAEREGADALTRKDLEVHLPP